MSARLALAVLVLVPLLPAQVLIADLRPGPGLGSAPGGFGDARTATVFSADDGVRGRELFATRGTSATTALLADLFPGFNDSDPSPTVRIGDPVVFLAVSNSIRYCWRSDGTAAGTQIVPLGLDLRGMPAPLPFDTMTAIVFGSRFDVYTGVRSNFVVRLGDGNATMRMWSEGTMLLPQTPWRAGDTVLFSSGTMATGRELWSEGGFMLELNPGPAGSDPGAGLRLSLSGFSLFSANAPATGTELWRSDGTPAGTALLADLAPGAGSSDPRGGVVSGPLAFFVATTPALGAELWRSDGTAAGTWAIDVRAGSSSSDPAHLTAQHGGVYFAATDSAGDRELWFSDGTAAGTQRTADLASGSSSPVVLAAVGSRRVFFTADDGINGRELWQTDGTAAGTRMLLPLQPGNGDPAITALHLRRDGLLLFAADDGVHGSELFVHDPSAVAIPFGGGCGAFLQPRFTVNDPVLGGSALLRWESRRAGIGALLLGFPGYAVLPGTCEVHLDLGAPIAVRPIAMPGGTVKGALLVPNAPALQGLVLALQIIAGPSPMPLGADLGNAYGLRLGL